MRILYVSHYGILEPLGQSQILPYLTRLSRGGHSIHILSFEKPADLGSRESVDRQRALLDSCGIGWSPRAYRRGNSIRHLLLDIWKTSGEIRRRCISDRIDVLHCRAHIPGWMGLSAAGRLGVPMLFDFRGFLAEEYVDAGMWSARGPRYRAAKMLERILIRRCAALVVLTESIGRHFVQRLRIPRGKLFIVPCCVDLERFHPAAGVPHLAEDSPVKAIYLGSTTGRYRLDAMLKFFSMILDLRPGSKMTVVSSGDLGEIELAVASSGVPRGSIQFCFAPPREVPDILRKHDLGLAFIRGDLALQAASPTKIGEYLASGLAVVADERVGGLQQILAEQGVGCLVDSGDPATWPRALQAILAICGRPGFRSESLAAARKFYDLEQGVKIYARAYEHCMADARARHGRRRPPVGVV